MKSNECAVDGCERPAQTREWCSSHYQRLRRSGEIPRVLFDNVGKVCSVDGCDASAKRLGMCVNHYMRQRVNGDPGPAELLRKPHSGSPVCSVEGCDRKHNGTELCHMHYMRKRVHGDVGQPESMRDGNNRWHKGNGYIVLSGGQMEHRFVMEQTLGRKLEPHENVHHINGIRHDNRPENLELWVKPQPCGQRPSDLVEWVVEHYPELVEAALNDRHQLRLIV